MLDRLEDIAKRRKRVGLTQTQLARAAGVSQSLIAKVEKGMDVSVSKANAIFAELARHEKKEQATAKDLMFASVTSVSPKNKVGKASGLMTRHDFSQLPVMSGGRCLGSISDQTINRKIGEGYDFKALSNLPVEEVMDEAFPTVSESTGLMEISALLRNNLAVLVTRKGEIVGIITKSNVVESVKGKV